MEPPTPTLGEIVPIDTDKEKTDWRPYLNATQSQMFDDGSDVVGASGEKGSGKSLGVGHKVVRHCFEEHNGFVVVVSTSHFTGREGFLGQLERIILPCWAHGNTYPPYTDDGQKHPYAGMQMDEGIGLRYSETRNDPATKDRYILIENILSRDEDLGENRFTRMEMKSIPAPTQVQARVFGPPISMAVVEELTVCGGPEYFRLINSQVGRRENIVGPQQFCFSCNPDGPSHWVFKELFELKETDQILQWRGEHSYQYMRDSQIFSLYSVPISENMRWLPPGYVERLKATWRNSPLLYDRFVNGLWRDAPPGTALFADVWDETPGAGCVLGDAAKGYGILPDPKYTAFISLDPGPVNFAGNFMQPTPVGDRHAWLVFDEVNYVGQPKKYRTVCEKFARRMRYWEDKLKAKMRWIFLIDEASFNASRANNTADATELQDLMSKAVGAKVKFIPVPKGNQSVSVRGRITHEAIAERLLMVSATCVKTREMLRMIPHQPVAPGDYDPLARYKRSDKSRYRHQFDALSYALMYFAVSPREAGSYLPNQKPASTVSFSIRRGNA